MSTVLAQVRPDSWNFPLLVHITGAMILVGGVLTTTTLLAVARGDSRLLRLGYRAMLILGVPGYILMRAGAEWIAEKEGWNKEGITQPDWIGIGYIVADGGFVLLLMALIAGGIGLSRIRKGESGENLLKGTLYISVVLLVAYTIAVWAMSGKPG